MDDGCMIIYHFADTSSFKEKVSMLCTLDGSFWLLPEIEFWGAKNYPLGENHYWGEEDWYYITQQREYHAVDDHTLRAFTSQERKK